MKLRMKDGMFFSVLERCKDYTVEFFIENETYLLGTEKFVTLCNEESEEIIKNAYLTKYALAGTVSDDKTLEWIEKCKVKITDNITGDIIATFRTDSIGSWSSNYLDSNLFKQINNFYILFSKFLCWFGFSYELCSSKPLILRGQLNLL